VLLIFWPTSAPGFGAASWNHDLCPKMAQLVTPSDKICQNEAGARPFCVTLRPQIHLKLLKTQKPRIEVLFPQLWQVKCEEIP